MTGALVVGGVVVGGAVVAGAAVVVGAAVTAGAAVTVEVVEVGLVEAALFFFPEPVAAPITPIKMNATTTQDTTWTSVGQDRNRRHGFCLMGGAAEGV